MNTIFFNNSIKLTLIILLLICLLDMPYGFYQLVRFVAFIGFSILAYNENLNNRKFSIIIYFALALLFQPFFKIALGRNLWNIIDVIVAMFLITSLLTKPTKANDKK